jgi:purine nucleoside permease
LTLAAAGRGLTARDPLLTTFDGEQEPFLRHQRWDRTFPAAGGEFAPIYCRTADHVCVTMTGTTKSKSGPSTMALLRDPRLQLDRRSLFIVAGIAGIRSQVGTLGSAGLADWIVDVDLGTHFVDRRQAPPHGWLPFDAYDQAAYRLNAELVSQAYQATRQLTLDDDQTAEAERAYYGPAEVAETPRVQRCDRPGTSPRALYDLLHSPAGFAGYNISRENAYRVAWQLAHTL